MAEITGLKVLGRECAPGDEVMNEWTRQIMTIDHMELVQGESVKLHCVKADGRKEIILGNWDATTRLVTRKVPNYEPELTAEEIAMGGDHLESEYSVKPGDCDHGDIIPFDETGAEMCTQCGYIWESRN